MEANVEPSDRLVLVVDDEQAIRDVVGSVIEDELAVTVVRAADGREALRSVRTRTPSLIITDVLMPRLTGDQLVRLLRDDSATEAIPILVMAGTAARRDEAMAAGADDYLDKPFNLDELVGKVQALLFGGRNDSAGQAARDEAYPSRGVPRLRPA